jgi:hypothetical protein
MDKMTSLITVIDASQQEEKEMYDLLRSNADAIAAGRQANLSDDQRDFIVGEINKETEKRKAYYTVVQTFLDAQSKADKAATAVLAQQKKMASFLEESLDASKVALNQVAEANQKQLKMFQINTYFGKLYESYAYIAKTVVVLALLLLVPYAARDKIPEAIVKGYSSVVMTVGGVYLLYLLFDQNFRDNQVFDEKTWPLAPSRVTQLNDANDQNIIDISGISIPSLCGGEYCCGPGTVWSDASGCVVAPESNINA